MLFIKSGITKSNYAFLFPEQEEVALVPTLYTENNEVGAIEYKIPLDYFTRWASSETDIFEECKLEDVKIWDPNNEG